MNTTTKNTNEKVNVSNLNSAKLSKGLQRKVEKVQTFLSDKTKEINSFSRLAIVSANVEIQSRGLNKAIKFYLECAKDILTAKQLQILTFNEICSYIKDSEKYKNYSLYSNNDIKLICNAILKAKDINTKRAAKVERQNKNVAKK